MINLYFYSQLSQPYPATSLPFPALPTYLLAPPNLPLLFLHHNKPSHHHRKEAELRDKKQKVKKGVAGEEREAAEQGDAGCGRPTELSSNAESKEAKNPDNHYPASKTPLNRSLKPVVVSMSGPAIELPTLV
jgi:hypothetical protein